MSADTAMQIHQASLALLEEPGIQIDHDEIAQLLLKNGAKPSSMPNVLRLPAAMINYHLSQCPRQVVLAGRCGRQDVLAPEGPSAFWSCPGMMLWKDNCVRPFTSTDMAAISRLMERLDNVQGVFGMSLDDVPPPVRDIVGLKVMAANCTKHIRVLCFSPLGARGMLEIKKVVGKEPWFSVGFTAHGPLRWTRLALDIFKETAGQAIPASINGEPMAGVSGPVTLAGAAAVGNAEILAGVVINQLLEPGRPLIYNLGLAHVMDMRTALAVTGGPENALLAGISAMMGRFYNLPSASWVSTEAMSSDEQAALEKMFGFHSHMASGVSNVWGVGQLESEISLSPAQAVIDNEMISYVKRYLRGVQVTDNTLAVDVTRKVGPAGSFLEMDHTLDNFRQEIFHPSLLFRQRRQQWQEGGEKSLTQRAEEVAAQLMAQPVDCGLSSDQLREIDAITSRFLGMAK